MFKTDSIVFEKKKKTSPVFLHFSTKYLGQDQIFIVSRINIKRVTFIREKTYLALNTQKLK